MFMQQIKKHILILINVVLVIILLLQFREMKQFKILFQHDSKLKSRQIQRLDAGIDFNSKRTKFILLARDSVILKHNKSLSSQEAYDIAEFNLYVSEKYNIDPILLLAIQRQESRFDTKAISEKGAKGLNQIYPLTGRMLCDIRGIQYYENLLFDHKINTELAVTYLDYLKAEYLELDLILIGYNAGPAWIKWKNKKELPEETQNYIIAVKKFYSEFEQRLAFYLPGSVLNNEG